MSHYHLQHLDRKAYINSIETITDERSHGFAHMALRWWDRHFSWSAHGCIVLCDVNEQHLSYIFYKIDAYKEYMTIHNLFTPAPLRKKGYAKELLSQVFDEANELHVKRFKLSSISQSLDFYMTLGFIYWGVTSIGDYYCDLPMPIEGLEDLDHMIATSSTKTLLGNKCEAIKQKVYGNENIQEKSKQEKYANDTKKLASHFRLADLHAHTAVCDE